MQVKFSYIPVHSFANEEGSISLLVLDRPLIVSCFLIVLLYGSLYPIERVECIRVVSMFTYYELI